MHTLTGRWVFPVEGPPLERGLVTVDGERIVAVETHGARQADQDFGDAAILPGLVNAHTHLDLTGLRGRALPTEDFTAWLRGVIGHRRAMSPEQVEADIRAGLADSLKHGTTLLGDIAAAGQSWPALAACPIRAVVLYELLGLPRERAGKAWHDACLWLDAHRATPTCRPGLSPHAPYSVHAVLYDLATRRSRRDRLALATHLAESTAELQLLAWHNGPFVAFLTELGVWDPDGLVPSVERIVRRHRRTGPALFVHANYLSPPVPIPTHATVIYCPRTHAAFGHAPHPVRELLARGVRVALGTDSLASNPDLNVLAEARFLHQIHREIPGAVLLRMATLSGAEALGWQEETGSLAPGKSADLVVLPLPPADAPDPHSLVLEATLPVRAVMSRGRWCP
jgi:cytosine/adenosine deaminase-related metal-dependent hydrolase